MSPDQLEDDQVDDSQTDESSQEKEDLTLSVEVDSPSACERHVTVTIDRADIDRYFDEAFSELMPTASIPGFRSGRAPRKLVESRFQKDVKGQVKGSLLMDSMEQIADQQDFTAISEPDFDFEAIDLPDEGPMKFEFNIEVRPDFELPNWKGMKVVRSVHEFSDEDVQDRLGKILARFGKLVPHDGAADPGDFLTVKITCRDGKETTAFEEETVVELKPTLSFRDGQLAGFDKLMKGAKADDKRSADLELTEDAPNEALRGKKVSAEFEVLEVKKLELPELNAEFLGEMGDFETKEDLEKAIRADLERQLEYQQAQQIRQQTIDSLTESADWDLPPNMLKRQAARELERAVLEMRRNGFGEAEIRARENILRQNSAESTAKALKEHFILERIAEEEEIDAEGEDYEMEIALIAMQSGQSSRRVRAQLEKREMMDVLRNQIVERKVIQLIRDNATFKDEPYEIEKDDMEALDIAAGGGDKAAEIPEAMHAPDQEPSPGSAASQVKQRD